MKKCLVGMCVALIVMSTSSWGENTASGEPDSRTVDFSSVSLMGSWVGSYSAHVYGGLEDGVKSSKVTMTLEITAQDKDLILGNHSWQLQDGGSVKSDIGGEIVSGGTEDLVGIVHFDGKSVTLLETIDNGRFELEIVDENELQAIYIESEKGEATIFRTTLKRADNAQ